MKVNNITYLLFFFFSFQRNKLHFTYAMKAKHSIGLHEGRQSTTLTFAPNQVLATLMHLRLPLSSRWILNIHPEEGREVKEGARERERERERYR